MGITYILASPKVKKLENLNIIIVLMLNHNSQILCIGRDFVIGPSRFSFLTPHKKIKIIILGEGIMHYEF